MVSSLVVVMVVVVVGCWEQGDPIPIIVVPLVLVVAVATSRVVVVGKEPWLPEVVRGK
jgi:hypothetical protein